MNRDPLDDWGYEHPFHEVTCHEDQGPHRVRAACALLMSVGLVLGIVVWGIGLWRGWWG